MSVLAITRRLPPILELDIQCQLGISRRHNPQNLGPNLVPSLPQWDWIGIGGRKTRSEGGFGPIVAPEVICVVHGLLRYA